MSTTLAYIALGANLGDRLATIDAAIDALGELGRVTARSSIYQTVPVGFAEQPAYLNGVVALETAVTPVDLLNGLLAIERRFGRVRTFLNAPRTLDLDLLLYGDLVLSEDRLAVPHPRMRERAFVLVPLAEIAPDLIVPVAGRSVAELLHQLAPVSGIELCRSADPGSGPVIK